MNDLVGVVVIGFIVIGLLILDVLKTIGQLREDIQGLGVHLDSIARELGWNGTIYKQLVDIEHAINRS
jgi:hypothetical protein